MQCLIEAKTNLVKQSSHVYVKQGVIGNHVHLKRHHLKCNGGNAEAVEYSALFLHLMLPEPTDPAFLAELPRCKSPVRSGIKYYLTGISVINRGVFK